MKIAFFGSGPFAIPIFEALLAITDEYPLVAVVSRPDRQARRGRKTIPMPVKARAVELGVECDSPETVNSEEYIDRLRGLEADLFVVADYGEILKESFLQVPRIGAFNLHGSILPKYRGAAPVARAIQAGETSTGVTLFRIERGLDSGPVVAISTTDIDPAESAGELEARLSDLAAKLIVDELPRFAAGSFTETPQDASESTYAHKLAKEEGLVDWRRSADEIVRHVRSMTPWPSAFAFLEQDGRRSERTTFLRVEKEEEGETDSHASPGDIVDVTKVGFCVVCGDGERARVLELKREGKDAMHAAAYLRGKQFSNGDRFRGAEEESET